LSCSCKKEGKTKESRGTRIAKKGCRRGKTKQKLGRTVIKFAHVLREREGKTKALMSPQRRGWMQLERGVVEGNFSRKRKKSGTNFLLGDHVQRERGVCQDRSSLGGGGGLGKRSPKVGSLKNFRSVGGRISEEPTHQE